MLIPALLVALWTAICTFDLFGPQLCFWRPLIAGSITGLILGDFTQGMIIASALELMWLGVSGIGAYVPPDVVCGSILGTAVGVLSGQGAVASIAIAVPVAVVAQQLDVLARTISVFFTHRADKVVEEGDFDKAAKYHLRCLPLFLLTRSVPVFLAIFFGAEHVTTLFSVIPSFIQKGLTVAGGMLPALGFGLLLSLMINKKLWVFFLLGFVLNVYMKLPTIGLAMVGIVFAILYDAFTRSNDKDNHTPAADEAAALATEKGGIDL
ncbi:PTS mannose/fructose/sorbose/N-acetylgalactosamine transporter subunit IIC [Caproiciproducens sp. R1]|uniref:PTS mannose/fructose/sorbose/N-acetylgalactosamine transporter subunit IIC n=1 Tax=Caproiciproducens sp. R1 TaxID=3435000 RepID=UPI0040347D2A